MNWQCTSGVIILYSSAQFSKIYTEAEQDYRWSLVSYWFFLPLPGMLCFLICINFLLSLSVVLSKQVFCFSRTTKRHCTLYDGQHSSLSGVCHIPMAEPFCTKTREVSEFCNSIKKCWFYGAYLWYISLIVRS